MRKNEETKLIICDNCGVKAAHIVKRPQVLGRGTKMMLVDNVPVIACRNCSENYMKGETMHRLDKIRMKQKIESVERKVGVAEFMFE